jgi:hypothetical protein
MTKNKIITFFTLAFLLQLVAINSFAQKSVELKYNLTEGDVYNYVMELDQDIVFETNGQTMALDMLLNFEMTQKVAVVTADSIKLEGQIKRVKSKQAIFGMEISYDSDDPTSAQNPMTAKMGEEFAKVLNKSFFMMMDHQGKLGNMDLSGVSDNDELANNINSGSQFAVYPKGKISVGDSWEEDINPVETSDMKFHATYTLLKVSGKEATLGVEGIITANEMEDMEIKLDGTMKGEMVVDVKTGWLIKSTMNQELEMDLEQNGMKFPATTSGTIVTTSTKAN